MPYRNYWRRFVARDNHLRKRDARKTYNLKNADKHQKALTIKQIRDREYEHEMRMLSRVGEADV